MKFEKLRFKALGVGFKEIYCCGKLKSVIIAIVESMKKIKCNKDYEYNAYCKTKYHYVKANNNHFACTPTQVIDDQSCLPRKPH
jgi:hypothetical protein